MYSFESIIMGPLKLSVNFVSETFNKSIQNISEIV